MIETDRLTLRSMKISDVDSFAVLFADPKVMKSSIDGTKTSEEVRKWLLEEIENRQNSRGVELLAVLEKSTANVIGYCGLSLISDIDGETEIAIGYRLIRQCWGCGYATESARAVRDHAFAVLALHRIVALIEPINTKSIAVAKKIGMCYEKDVLLKEYDYPDHLYSINRTGCTQICAY